MPTSAQSDESDRQREDRVPVEDARRELAHQRLRDVGAIGADHDHLAVRHVDDAQQAVGDRKPHRCQHQDAAEREAGEDPAEVFVDGQPTLHSCHCKLRRFAHPRIRFDEAAVGVGAGEALQGGQHVAPTAAAQRFQRLEPHGRILGRDLDECGRRLQLDEDLGILLAGQGLLEPRQQGFVRPVLQFARSREPLAPIGGEEPQRGERRRDRIAHPIVDGDRARLGIRLRNRLTRPGITPSGCTNQVAVRSVIGDSQRIVRQRPQDLRRLLVGLGGKPPDGAVAILRIATGEQLERLVDGTAARRSRARRRNRRLGKRGKRQQQQDREKKRKQKRDQKRKQKREQEREPQERQRSKRRSHDV